MNDEELYATFHRSIPIFPYITPSVSDDQKKYLLFKNKMKISGYSTKDEFKKGLENAMRCIVTTYYTTDSVQIVSYADAIAGKAGRKRDLSLSGIQSFQYEIILTIYSYSKSLQPTGPLSFNTLLRATLVNPYLQGLVDLPNTFLRCIPKVEFTKAEGC